MNSTISDIKLIQLPKIEDPRGNLSSIEEEIQIPFKIARTYWIYDVPGGQIRDGHAFIQQNEFIIALSGSFDIVINDGTAIIKYTLSRSYYGLFVPSGIWRQMENFSTNSVAMVISSTFYSEIDYIRDYQQFLKFKGL
jgi:hypothetical protein